MTEYPCREDRIQAAIERSKIAFYEGLEARETQWLEFLIGQFSFIRKRWWVFQLFFLIFLWGLLYFWRSEPVFRRDAAALIVMFVVLIIPELWKNAQNHSTEVENAACFTMRQIYAARLTIFGLVDLCLLTFFFLAAILTVRITLLDIIIQFLIPLNVASCICLAVLAGGWFQSEYAAVGFCIIWTGVWYWLLNQEQIYRAISGPAWVGLLFLSIAGAAAAGKRLLMTDK